MTFWTAGVAIATLPNSSPRRTRRISQPDLLLFVLRERFCAPWRASLQPLAEGLIEEGYLFQKSLRTKAAQERMRRFTQIGGQTYDGEMMVSELVERVGEAE